YVLSEKLKYHNFKIIENNTIRIYDQHIATQELSKILTLNDVEIMALGQQAETLEDYFLKLTAEVSRSC
ncbi:MAG: ABC transporter ATP-binding protein, partial [Blautia sp.]|nr:ABC transporter ATP-binding protein [Blautia sp.]